MNIIVASPRSKKTICELTVDSSSTVLELKKQFSKQKKLGVERQRFTFEHPTKGMVALTNDKETLSNYGVTSGTTIYFKDLGMQISWTLVFLAEYAGPLFVYPIFYYFSKQIYGLESQKTFVQDLALLCYSLHYIKRILETIFVHRFSKATMPISNLFKNCIYYWGCTSMVSYFVNHPLYTPPATLNTYIGFGLWAFGEVMNLVCHIQLRNLRPAGSNVRRIPRGLLFEFVSCPNYTVEILAWFGFSIMTQTLTSYIFTLLGAGQMYIWACGKHRNYKKEFTGKDGTELYPRNRKIIVPFLL